VLIPLTFGNGSDWVCNVRAAGGASVVIRRRSYEMGVPEFLNWPQARPIIRARFPVARGVFKVLGIKQFIQASVLDSNDAADKSGPTLPIRPG
jgi:hypothetical protein